MTNTQRNKLQIFQRNVEKFSEYIKITTTSLLDKGLSIADTANDSGKGPNIIHRYMSFYISDELAT